MCLKTVYIIGNIQTKASTNSNTKRLQREIWIKQSLSKLLAYENWRSETTEIAINTVSFNLRLIPGNRAPCNEEHQSHQVNQIGFKLKLSSKCNFILDYKDSLCSTIPLFSVHFYIPIWNGLGKIVKKKNK